jgi:hypothetical protein
MITGPSWGDWVAYMEGLAENPDRVERGEIDRLALAVARLGRIEGAAENLGVSKQTIYTWLESGLGKAQFERVVRLSQASDIPIEALAKRLGPFPHAPDIKAHVRTLGKANGTPAKK